VQALDRERAVAALERHACRLQVLALLRERLDPARHVPRALEALDRAVEVVRARVRLARAQELARGAEHRARALVIADRLEQLTGLVVLGERLVQLGRGRALARLLVVTRRSVELAALLVEAREQPARDLCLALALERACGGRDVAVQIGLDGERAAREHELRAVAQVEHEHARLERLDRERRLGDAVGAARDDVVPAAIERELDGTAREPQRVGRAIARDQRLLDRAPVPGHAHLDRARARREVEREAHRRIALRGHLLLGEMRRDDVLALRGLQVPVDRHEHATARDGQELRLARDAVADGRARVAGRVTRALLVAGRGKPRRARGRARARVDLHAERAAQADRVFDRHGDRARAAHRAREPAQQHQERQ
jgi:hypothetical protein